jgi:hypothetical protein
LAEAHDREPGEALRQVHFAHRHLGPPCPSRARGVKYLPAAIFRVVEAWTPALSIDEADTFLSGNDELRDIINSGHTKSGAFVVRTVGDDHEPKKFSTRAPMAIAMIKAPPGTILDRSIVVRLRRRLPGEWVD